MAIDGIGGNSVYPVDSHTVDLNSKKAEEKKAAEAKAAEVTAVGQPKAEAAPPKADGFQKAPFGLMDMNNPGGPFQVVVSNKGADKMNNLLNLVQSMFGQQGKVASVASGNILVIDQQTQDAAKAAIAEDGYWGATQTAGRLLDFAKALSGGDASKIEELRGAVQKGYKAVADMFGGKLPQVTLDTYDKVMAGFDAWADEMNPPAEEAPAPDAVQPGSSVTDAE